MYFYDVNILFYVLAIVLSVIIGQIVDYCAKTFIKGEKIFSKESVKLYRETFKMNLLIIIPLAILYVLLLFKFKIKKELFLNLELIKCLILIPILICVFIVDIKKKIVPNRLNLTLFEVGLLIVFIYGINREAIAIDCIYALMLNAGIFLLITLLGWILLDKESLGMGDVKLMAVLGLYMGTTNSINIFILSFIIGAIVSIYMLIAKKKELNTYIPFAPCIVIATIFTIYMPINILTLMGNLIIV